MPPRQPPLLRAPRGAPHRRRGGGADPAGARLQAGPAVARPLPAAAAIGPRRRRPRGRGKGGVGSLRAGPGVRRRCRRRPRGVRRRRLAAGVPAPFPARPGEAHRPRRPEQHSRFGGDALEAPEVPRLRRATPAAGGRQDGRARATAAGRATRWRCGRCGRRSLHAAWPRRAAWWQWSRWAGPAPAGPRRWAEVAGREVPPFGRLLCRSRHWQPAVVRARGPGPVRRRRPGQRPGVAGDRAGRGEAPGPPAAVQRAAAGGGLPASEAGPHRGWGAQQVPPHGARRRPRGGRREEAGGPPDGTLTSASGRRGRQPAGCAQRTAGGCLG
mmetsp:Transcript_78090/g.246680  ORF Transcript_78090/g.246680 Transcript_78090/m.246680 type:complete len:327 (+) Transcript_78090:164-1144(+)